MRNSKRDFFTDPDRLAEGFLISEYIWDANPQSKELSKALMLQADYSLRNWRDEFYKWQDGKYTKLSDAEIKKQITTHLRGLNNNCSICDDDQHIRITAQLVNNVLLCVSSFEGVHLCEQRELNSWDDSRESLSIVTFVFENGVLMKHSQKGDCFIKHKPAYFSVSKLPYDYEPDAKPDRWLQFLNEVMDGDGERIELLQQWSGYCLSSQNSYQKFMLIAGEGANGKTVFTKIIEKMVGEQNVSHIPLSLFSQQFSLYSTLGKNLNSTSESSHRLDELAETALKSFTSSDAMTFQRKYKEPIHSKPTAKVMLSTNQLPNFADKSIGIWRRMLYVPFDVTIEADRQNHKLVDELCCELPAIFNWALEGLQKLKDAGRFAEPRRCIAAIEQYRRDVNPARTFLLENFTPTSSCRRQEWGGFDSIACKELYDSYVNWCFENGYRPMNSSNFGKEVKRAFSKIKKTKIRNLSNSVWIYSGLNLKEDSEINVPSAPCNI
jgi:P4 family phage/plasmid primase-like protien